MIILIKRTIAKKLTLHYYIDVYTDLIASSILSLDVVPMLQMVHESAWPIPRPWMYRKCQMNSCQVSEKWWSTLHWVACSKIYLIKFISSSMLRFFSDICFKGTPRFIKWKIELLKINITSKDRTFLYFPSFYHFQVKAIVPSMRLLM